MGTYTFPLNGPNLNAVESKKPLNSVTYVIFVVFACAWLLAGGIAHRTHPTDRYASTLCHLSNVNFCVFQFPVAK